MVVVLLAACGAPVSPGGDDDAGLDAAVVLPDAGDMPELDAGEEPVVDAGEESDAGHDAGQPTVDAGRDSGTPVVDAGRTDAGAVDSGIKPDAGRIDAGPPVDAVFSFAVMPDTQQEILNDTNSNKFFVNRVTWLNSNWAAQDFRFVMHTGDAANWGNVDPLQFDRISNAFKAFDMLGRPYAIAPGNHDTAAVCTGGSACPGKNASIEVRNTIEFNKRFPPSRLIALKGVFEAGKSDNAFHTFSAGGVDWLVVTLELWPRTVVVEWAKTVVSTHPKHNVIFVTHMHLDAASNISPSNGGYGANSPQYVWDNLYSKYPNVRFVFSGHVGSTGFKESVGAAGNKVFQLLGCFHSNTDNPVRLVEVNTQTNSFTTRVYGPFSNTTYAGSSYSGTGAAWIHP